MTYVRLTCKDETDGTTFVVKAIAKDSEAMDLWLDTLPQEGTPVVDMFRDDSFGNVCVLPEDFKY